VGLEKNEYLTSINFRIAKTNLNLTRVFSNLTKSHDKRSPLVL